MGDAVLIHPVPARSAHMISFHFGGPVGVRFYGTDTTRIGKTATLVGPQTHQRCQLIIRGYVDTFVIVFRPSAIHRLFGLPAVETIDSDYPAPVVLGSEVSALTEELGNAHSFQERVQIADRFIIKRSSTAHAAGWIELAANEIVLSHGGCRIDSLVRHTGLSIRSFQRMFQHHIGVSPKLFSRIVRFESALKAKAAAPHVSWLTVAHQFGYHDQMHLVNDFKRLSGEAPTSLLGRAEAVLRPQIDSTPELGAHLLQL